MPKIYFKKFKNYEKKKKKRVTGLPSKCMYVGLVNINYKMASRANPSK